jgi:hypothetical protein
LPASDFDSAVERHAAQYEQVAAALALLMAQVATASDPRLAPQAQEQARKWLAALLEASRAWIAANTRTIYERGAQEAQGAPGGRRSVAEVFRGVEHRETLQGLGETLLRDLAKAVTEMGNDFDNGLEAIRRQRNAEALETRNAPKAAAGFARDMRERGIAYTDRSGRRWNPRHYAATCLYTHVATTLNAGTLLTAAQMGSPGVAVSDGGPGDVDEPCRKADGQRWSLAYAIAHPIEHPNCRRAFAPLSPRFTGELDRGAA